jgi:DNA-binding transcriptional MocR family regulator
MVPAWQESVRAIRSNPMAGIRTNSRLATDLLVELRRDAPDPLHRQISATIRDGIRSGRLGLGTSLPPTRTVAADLGVSRGGVPEVHEALAGYLNRARGTSAQPGNVVMCNGYAQGIALLIQVLAKSGAKRIAVEGPVVRR